MRSRVRRVAAGLAGLVLAVLVAGTPAGAASLSLHAVEVVGTLPRANPAYPVPRDAGQVFYIQRSMNSNTVVYRANLRGDGSLDPRDPITAYWRRFNDAGEAVGLSFLERQFAYGVGARPLRGEDGFRVRFVALPALDFRLRIADGAPGLFLTEAGRELRLAYGYLDLDERGTIPRVTRLQLVGRAVAGGDVVRLTYDVSGGEVRP